MRCFVPRQMDALEAVPGDPHTAHHVAATTHGLRERRGHTVQDPEWRTVFPVDPR